MAIKQELDTLLAKKMDRRDFLRHIGVGIVGVTGLAAVIKTLGSMGAPETVAVKQPLATRRRGYGNSGYGSKTETSS